MMREAITQFERLTGVPTVELGATAISPDGRWLAATGSEARSVCFWDLTTGLQTRTVPLGFGGLGVPLAFSSDNRLALLDAGCRLLVVDPAKDVRAQVVVDLHSPVATRWHPDCAVEGRPETAALGGCHGDGPPCLAWSPCGRKVAVATRCGLYGQVLVASGQAVWLAALGDSAPEAMSYSSNGLWLGVGYGDGRAAVLDQRAQVVVEPFDCHLTQAPALAWSPDGRTLATGGGERTVWLVEPASGVVGQHQLEVTANDKMSRGHRWHDWVMALAFSPAGERLAVGFGDAQVCLFDLVKEAVVGPPHSGAVDQIAAVGFTSDGLVWVDQWGMCVVADPLDGAVRRHFLVVDLGTGELDQLQWHSGGHLLVMAWWGWVVLFDSAAGRVKLHDVGVQLRVGAMELGPAGDCLVVVTCDYQVKLFDLTADLELYPRDAGEVLVTKRFAAHEQDYWSKFKVEWLTATRPVVDIDLADGWRSAAAGVEEDRRALERRVTAKHPLTGKLCSFADPVLDVDWTTPMAWSPDAAMLALATNDCSVRLYTPDGFPAGYWLELLPDKGSYCVRDPLTGSIVSQSAGAQAYYQHWCSAPDGSGAG